MTSVAGSKRRSSIGSSIVGAGDEVKIKKSKFHDRSKSVMQAPGGYAR